MKILTIASLLFFAIQAFADLGGCVVYKAKYVMKNGQSVTGYLPLWSYEDYSYLDEHSQSNAYCSDKAFQQLLNRVFYQEQKKLEFGLFEKLDLVQFSQAASRNQPFSVGCAFTDSVPSGPCTWIVSGTRFFYKQKMRNGIIRKSLFRFWM